MIFIATRLWLRLALAAGIALAAGPGLPAMAQDQMPLAVPERNLPKAGDFLSPAGTPFRHVVMRRAEAVSLQLGWRNGYALMLPARQGTAAIGAQLMLQGPKGETRGEFAEDLKDEQARISLSVTSHATLASLTAPPDKFEAAIKLFARALADPALNPDHLEEIREAHLTNLKEARRRPDAVAGRALALLRVPEGPLRSWLVAGPAQFEAVKLEDIAAWRKAVLVRDGVTIASAGALPAEAMGRYIDTILAPLPERGVIVEPVIPALQAPSKTVVVEMPGAQTILLVSTPTSIAVAPDQTKGVLAARILTTRLFASIRGKLGAAYGITAAMASTAEEPYALQIRTNVEHDKAEAALAAIRAELDRFIRDGVSAAELEPEKAKVISEFQESMRRAPTVALNIHTAMLRAFPADHVEKTVQRISAITAEAVNAELAAKIPGKAVLAVIVAPSAAPFKADCVLASLEAIGSCQ